MDGERDVLGLWLGPTGGKGAKQWMTMLTELRNRGVADSVDRVLRRPQRLAGHDPSDVARRDRADLCRAPGAQQPALRVEEALGSDHPRVAEIYTAPTVAAAEVRFGEFAITWRDTYPAMVSSWENAWAEFVPFLEFPIELRTIVYTTNAIESLDARSAGRSVTGATSQTNKPR